MYPVKKIEIAKLCSRASFVEWHMKGTTLSQLQGRTFSQLLCDLAWVEQNDFEHFESRFERVRSIVNRRYANAWMFLVLRYATTFVMYASGLGGWFINPVLYAGAFLAWPLQIVWSDCLSKPERH